MPTLGDFFTPTQLDAYLLTLKKGQGIKVSRTGGLLLLGGAPMPAHLVEDPTDQPTKKKRKRGRR